MSGDFSYEMPWRRNYEAMAVAGWLGGALVAGAGALTTEMSAAPYLWMSGVCGAMALARSPSAFRIRKLKSKLDSRDLWFMNHSELRELMAKYPGRVWLGKGFEWGQPQAQKAHDLLKRDTRGILPERDEEQMGATWIHGLGDSEKDITIPIGHWDGMNLITGTTGSGKTRKLDLLISQAIYRNEPVIVLDPKGDGEMRDNTRLACELSGAPERFVNFHLAFPEDSVRLDVLRNFNRTTEIASRIAGLTDSNQGPFKAYGQMALNALIEGCLVTGERPTLVSLRRYIDGSPVELLIRALESYCGRYLPDWREAAEPFLKDARKPEKKASGLIAFYRQRLQSIRPNPDLEGLINQFEHDRAHFSKMIAALQPVLSMLTSGELGPLLSPDANDVDDPRPITDLARAIENNQVVYIGLDSLSDPMVGGAVASILLAELANIAGTRYNYSQTLLASLKSVNIFIDEIAEVATSSSDALIQILNKGRGAKLRVTAATQTTEDLVARLGEEAKANQMLGNFNNVLTLRILDTSTQEKFSLNLPPTRVSWVMRTQASSTSADNPTQHSGNIGERLMEEEAELFPGPLLGALPNLEYVAKVSGNRIIKGRIPILVAN